MKRIEYYYNLIYYFFYRGFIKVLHFIRWLSSPLIKLLFFISEFFPATQRVYDKRGIKDPKKWYEQRMKNVDENPSLSLGTMYGATFSISSLGFIYVGVYKIVKNLFFPDFEDNFAYVISTFFFLAWLTHGVLSRGILERNKYEQGKTYIKKFNQIKDKKWRIKWAVITAFTFPLSITFMVLTSKGSYIGGFFYSLHTYLF